MSALLFYDPVCRQPYDTRSLRNQALGGTESTLARVADALGAFVMQHNRTEDWERYLRPGRLAGIEAVVVNRDSRALPFVLEHFPGARVFLWLHDRVRPGGRRARWLASTAALLARSRAVAVCVSDWQRADVEATLARAGIGTAVRAVTIYNAIDDALQPDGTPVDPGKLVFFSSPNKGLDYTLDAFGALRRALPDLRLVVGNPGYRPDRGALPAGVELLGAQPQARMHAEVRGALCTFCPNFVIPETFGLVYAESHALGTPVLAHDCGAALEVLGDPREALPLPGTCRLYEAAAGALPPRWRRGSAWLAARLGIFDAYVETVRAWRNGARPAVGPDPRFRLSTVAGQWRALLTA